MARILVVEDNEMNMDVLTRFLQRDGHTVLGAGDGRQAIMTARNEVPDIILMDLSLPEMDGWEATKRIRNNPLTKHIPIIALTAHSSSADVKRAVEAGCDQYETKPLEYERLLKKVMGVLERNGKGAGVLH